MPPIIWTISDAEAEDIAWAIAIAGDIAQRASRNTSKNPIARAVAAQRAARLRQLARSLDAATAASPQDRRTRLRLPEIAPDPNDAPPL